MAMEDRYAKLVNYLTDYIYTVTIEDGKAVNTVHGPGCIAVTGYSSEDYEKDPELWYRMVHGRDREKVLQQAQQALAGNDVKPLEHRIIHRDGSVRWIRNSIVITKDEHGTVIGYDGLINNITERKRAEFADAIRNEQLKQADKMASLGILVSGVAHEINNPNNFILLNTQLFSKIWKDVMPILEEYYAANGDFSIAGMSFSTSKEKLLQSLDSILKGSERIQTITKGLTDYARADSGHMNESVDLNKVVEMALIITNNLIHKSTRNFTVDYDPRIPPVKGNAQQLEQVIINLINNACQSLKDPSAAISVSTLYRPSQQIARIKIEDHGVGIAKDDLKHIMDPFFTTKRNMGGTGLGLSVSYSIVKSHGGSLVLTSEPHKGTIARVSLPVAQRPS